MQALRALHVEVPYGLNTPELLQANYKDYWQVLAQSKEEKQA